ncbi:MAG: hypothetical protein ABIK85_01105 [Candidatus Eisenbacteria bacterium]
MTAAARWLMVLILVAAVNGGPCSAQRTSTDDRLVWSIRVEETTGHLEVNHFDSMRPFPKDQLRIARVVDSSQKVGERLALDMRLEVAPLCVNADGTLESGGRAALEFFPEGRVSRGTAGGPLVVLRLPGDENRESHIPVSYVNLLDMPGQKILGWELLSPSGPAVLHTIQRTLFLQVDAGGLLEPTPLALYPHRTYGVAVSTGSPRLAAVAEYEETSPRPGGNSAQHRVVVFSPEGEIIMETSPERCSCSQLYMDPSGEALVFRRACQDEPAEIVALDIGSGTLASVEVGDGTRYYSGDGTRMVVIQMGFGTATY